jgi:hypothetical protein
VAGTHLEPTVTGQDACVTFRRLLGGALAGALAAVCAVPTPAAADVGRLDDPRRDTAAPADLVRVTVTNADRVVVAVRHRNLGFGARGPLTLRVAFDTGPRFDGPEFFLRVRYQTDAPVDLRTAGGWDAIQGPATGCTGERVAALPAQDVTRLSLPASCLGDPARLRVQVRLTAADGAAPDVAPSARTMGPAVRR